MLWLSGRCLGGHDSGGSAQYWFVRRGKVGCEMTICEEDVSKCPVFGNMSPEERQHVQQFAEYRTYNKGQTVIRERDEAPQGLWMLESGSCQVVKDLAGGAEQQMAMLHPGATFGEISFFDPGPHSATVRAVEQSELMFLPVEKIETLRVLDLSAAYKLVRNAGQIMSSRLRHMDQYTLDLFPSARTTPERL